MANLFVRPGTVNNTGAQQDTINFLAKYIYMSDKTTTVETFLNRLNGYFTNGSAKTAVKLLTARTITISGAVSGSGTFDGSANATINVPTVDATKLTGTIDIARLPKGALERMVVVANDTARFKLTTATVQNGDVVKVTADNAAYYVVDDTKLNQAAGYEVFPIGKASAVDWTDVIGKPTSFTPATHTHTPTQVGVIGTAPTNGQVAVFDGTTGRIKSTGYTIAKSVPSSAVFTDHLVQTAVNSANSKKYLIGVSGISSGTTAAYDTGVALTGNKGELQMTTLRLGDKATLSWNSTKNAIKVSFL